MPNQQLCGLPRKESTEVWLYMQSQAIATILVMIVMVNSNRMWQDGVDLHDHIGHLPSLRLTKYPASSRRKGPMSKTMPLIMTQKSWPCYFHFKDIQTNMIHMSEAEGFQSHNTLCLFPLLST